MVIFQRVPLDLETEGIVDCYLWFAGWWFGTFFIFPYIGNNSPIWLIFFRGGETTNQFVYWTLRYWRYFFWTLNSTQMVVWECVILVFKTSIHNISSICFTSYRERWFCVTGSCVFLFFKQLQALEIGNTYRAGLYGPKLMRPPLVALVNDHGWCDVSCLSGRFHSTDATRVHHISSGISLDYLVFTWHFIGINDLSSHSPNIKQPHSMVSM